MPAVVVMHRMAESAMKMSTKTTMKTDMMTRKMVTSKLLRGMKVMKTNMKMTTKTSMMMTRITMMMTGIKGPHRDTTMKKYMMMKIMVMSVKDVQETVHNVHQGPGHVGLHPWIVKKCIAQQAEVVAIRREEEAAAEEAKIVVEVRKENAAAEEEEAKATATVAEAAVAAAVARGGPIHRKEAMLVEVDVLPQAAMEEVDHHQDDHQVTLLAEDLLQWTLRMLDELHGKAAGHHMVAGEVHHPPAKAADQPAEAAVQEADNTIC